MSEDSIPEMTFAEMMRKPKIRYVASGDTYPHREEFTSWGWHWDAERHAWIEDNGSEPDDLCILAIRKLPSVLITQEQELEVGS